MRIGISGAGGQFGAAVIARLIKDCGQHALVGISRSPDSIEAPIEKREGDFDRPETLANTYVGLDRLLLIPSPDLQPGVRGNQLVSAIDAAVASGVGHMLLLSSVLANPADEPDAGAAFWQAE